VINTDAPRKRLKIANWYPSQEREAIAKARLVRQKCGEIPDARKGRKSSKSEAVERALLFLLVDGIHPLFEMGSSCLGLFSSISLLLDSLHRVPRILLRALKILNLLLQSPCFAFPHLEIVFGFLALGLEVNESFFESRRELFLRKEMLLDGADSSFLIICQLSTCQISTGMSRASRCRRLSRCAVGSTCCCIW
jgi:hypothetical protein